MTEGGVGRVLVASLHQAIADVLPSRLEFYEAWLNPSGLRDGRIGLAPLAALALLLVFLSICGLTVLIGLLNSRRIIALSTAIGFLP